MLGQVQHAASDAVEERILSSAMSNRFIEHAPNLGRPLQQPQFRRENSASRQQSGPRINGQTMLQPATPAIPQGGIGDGWNMFGGRDRNDRKFAFDPQVLLDLMNF